MAKLVVFVLGLIFIVSSVFCEDTTFSPNSTEAPTSISSIIPTNPTEVTSTTQSTPTTPNPTTPNPTTRPSGSTSNPNVDCSSGVQYIPDPHNCGVFYECSNGLPYELVCPPGTYFDTIKDVCSKTASCGNRPTTPGDPTRSTASN